MAQYSALDSETEDDGEDIEASNNTGPILQGDEEQQQQEEDDEAARQAESSSLLANAWRNVRIPFLHPGHGDRDR